MNDLDEILQVDTPENVAFGYDVAGIGSRFLAALVDTMILVGIQILFALLGAIFMLGSGFHATDSIPVWFSALVGLVSFLFYWGYYIFFEMQWNGQSPGKRWAKLRVIRTDGLSITLGESVIRNLVRLVDFLPIAYGLGVITMFAQPQARRLGDLAAGTLVIHDRKAASLHEMAQPQSQSHLAYHLTEHALSPFFPVEQLTPQDIQIGESFLQRRQQLSNRGMLAVQIVEKLYGRVGLEFPGMSMAQAEDALVAMVREYRRLEQENIMSKGSIVSINIAPLAGEVTVSVDEIRAVPGYGLEGDRFFAKQGQPHPQGRGEQVTMIEIEAIEALKHEKGIELDPKDARRNLVTRGVALNHLVGKEFRVGDVTLRGIRLCEPCGHLASLTQPEVTSGLVHRGGLRCDIVIGGTIRAGDEVSEI